MNTPLKWAVNWILQNIIEPSRAWRSISVNKLNDSWNLKKKVFFYFFNLGQSVPRVPPRRCAAARTLPVWTCWSCLAAVGPTRCSFADSSCSPRWSCPAFPPPGTKTGRRRSSLLWCRSLLLDSGGHVTRMQAAEATSRYSRTTSVSKVILSFTSCFLAGWSNLL